MEAFESIREDLGNSYTVTYYPQPNPNEGFRKINVEIVTDVARISRTSPPRLSPARRLLNRDRKGAGQPID